MNVSKLRNDNIGGLVVRRRWGCRGRRMLQLQNFSNMDSNQLKHNPFNIACLSLIEINRPSIVFRHCVKIQLFTSTVETLLLLPSLSLSLSHTQILITRFQIFHMKYETKTHTTFSSHWWDANLRRSTKKVSGLKCITWSEAVVWRKSKWCVCVRACERVHSSNRKNYFYLHVLRSRALDRSRFLKRDDK